MSSGLVSFEKRLEKACNIASSERLMLPSLSQGIRACSAIRPRRLAASNLHPRRNYLEQRSWKPLRSSDAYDAAQIAMAKQWKALKERGNKRRKVESRPIQAPIREGTNEEVLEIEVHELLQRNQKLLDASPDSNENESISKDKAPVEALPERYAEIELEIQELSSTGDGLALAKSRAHVYVVPFTVPGDLVLAKVVHQVRQGSYSITDFVKVIRPSPRRDDTNIKCKYFQTCAGCQLQMLPYEAQLAHKKTIVEKAFRNFSGLPSSRVPPVGDTVGSPLQFGYRTKMTPHFDGPPMRRSERRFTEVPPLGYTEKNRRKVLDIESCPLGTEILQEGLTRERAQLAKDFRKYTAGATILLRESTERTPISKEGGSPALDINLPNSDGAETVKELITTANGAPLLRITQPTHIDEKTYISDNNGFSTEYIDAWKFTSRAGSFFQNNNSILSRFTGYVRNHAFPPILDPSDPPIKYLLDAYCGSGLFAVTLSSLFTSALGIDIDAKAVEAARINAADNHIPNAGFIEADASALFADVPYSPEQTLVVIDPPRKGASEDFLRQLMRFGPKRVVYVSCNVHSQARDVGILVSGKGMSGWRYEIESIRGFDFFPQTGHVEGVAFLNRVENVM